MVTNVTVLDASKKRFPTLRQAFLRDIGYIIMNCCSLLYLVYLVLAGQYYRDAEVAGVPGTILGLAGLGWFFLEVVTMLTNDKRRALHDYIAGTVVVRDADRLRTSQTASVDKLIDNLRRTIEQKKEHYKCAHSDSKDELKKDK
jgi:uncharacterized RDD family membrane protein YckC